MSGKYRAKIGHPPNVPVTAAQAAFVGNSMTLTLGTSPGIGYEFPVASSGASPDALTGVATFHNIGLYWRDTNGATTSEALVRYRPVGGAWKQALSLWFDNREQGNSIDPSVTPTVVLRIPYGYKEYRGSIVGLQPGTSYQIEVMNLVTQKVASLSLSTWSETFPEWITTTLPSSSNQRLDISGVLAGGSPTLGYRVYTGLGPTTVGGAATIDVNKAAGECVYIDASYVILRGLTLRGGNNHGIRLSNNCHHVVIEKCDISDFGHQDGTTGYACEPSAGIKGPSGAANLVLNFTNIVIQNNKIHDPSFDSNSWGEAPRVANSSCQIAATSHPQGSSALEFDNTGGNHVIRYNEVYATTTKMFKDIFSGQQNFSFAGDFRRDTDIYGNRISHSWDDGIQAEGANMNNRIYENYIEYTLTGISQACCSIGPAYIFRNVYSRGSRTPDSALQGRFYKTYGKTLTTANPPAVSSNGTPDRMIFGGGRVFLFHNTEYTSTTATIGTGAVQNTFNADQLGLTSVVSKNNCYFANGQPPSAQITTISTAPAIPGCSFQKEAVPVAHTSWDSIVTGEVHINQSSAFTAGTFTPIAGSAIVDTAVAIPNFNDVYSGAGPDIGAQERGLPALVFGNR